MEDFNQVFSPENPFPGERIKEFKYLATKAGLRAHNSK
jgi:hypothetical protein